MNVPLDEAERQQRDRAPRFPLVLFNDVRLDTSRPYLAKGLVPRVGLTVIWGPPKCGKSFVTFDLVMRVALGWPYRDRRTAQGPVVYVACEGAEGFRARIEAFRQRHLAEDTGDDVRFYLVPASLDLVRDQPALVADIKGATVEPVVVVIDTLNRSLTGSESSDADMSAYVRAADAIREAFRCAVIVVHHCGVDGSRPRGHTSLTGAADAQIAVKKDGSGTITACVEWMKDGAEGETEYSRLEVVDVGVDEDGDPITSCVVVEANATAGETRSQRLTGANRTAFDLLTKAIADHGEIMRDNGHVPVGVQGVRAELWRNYCYAGTVTDSEAPDSKRRAFNRASKKLQEMKLIGVWNDLVWIAEKDSGTCGT